MVGGGKESFALEKSSGGAFVSQPFCVRSVFFWFGTLTLWIEHMTEGGDRAVGRNGYFEPYAFYAELYGSSERTVKRWVELGRSRNDRCELDDGEKLRQWWARNMTKVCPAEIMQAAIKMVSVSEKVIEAEVFEPRELEDVGENEVGLTATLKRLRDMEVRIHREMKKALERGDDAKLVSMQAAWTKLTAQVRTLEKEARAEAIALGDLIPRQYAEEKLVTLHSSIESGVRGKYRRMCEIFGTPIRPGQEKDWNKECDRLFIRFKEETFS